MKPHSLAVLLLASSLAGGCASLRATEAQQLAYQGQGPNPCLFGGVTPEADRHCEEIGQGLYGLLLGVNARASENLAMADDMPSCQRHVARVREALWEYPYLSVRSVFSCPRGREACHVSALVTAGPSESYVLDNGIVLDPGVYAASVGSFGQYLESVQGQYWFYPPGRQHLAAAAAEQELVAAAAVPARFEGPKRQPVRRH